MYNFDAPAKEFSAGSKIAPNESKFYNALGSVFQQRGQLSKAFELFHKAVTLDPNYAAAHQSISQIYERRLQFDQAADQLNVALKICPDADWIQIQMGNLLLHRARNESFAGLRAPSANPLKANSPLKRHPLDQTPVSSQALDHFDKAIEIAPRSADPY